VAPFSNTPAASPKPCYPCKPSSPSSPSPA